MDYKSGSVWSLQGKVTRPSRVQLDANKRGWRCIVGPLKKHIFRTLIFWILAFTNKNVELNFRRPTSLWRKLLLAKLLALQKHNAVFWPQLRTWCEHSLRTVQHMKAYFSSPWKCALRPPCFYILLRIKEKIIMIKKAFGPFPADVIVAHRRFNQTSVLNSRAASPGTSLTSTCRFKKGRQAKIDVWSAVN